jgi:amino acid adenylation domain-containing protein
MFEAQVARTPAAPALVTDTSLMSYADLNARANSLAHRLREDHGVGPEALVGVMFDRSEWMIVAILGILKAGAAFVPLDPAYPAERIDHILADTGLALLLTHSDQLAQWYEFSGATLLLDQELPGWTPLPDNPPCRAQPAQLAYVIYTSGSTGKPKGCLLEHRNLAHYIGWAADYYFPESTTGSFGLYSSLCFDFTLTNIFCPLVRGKTLRIYPQSESIDTILARMFQPGSGVDTLKLTPTHIHLLEYMNLGRSGVRKVIVGGEELAPQHIATLRKIDPAIEIYNEYGPTEATVGCIVERVDDVPSTVLIGRPIANTRVYIVDDALRPVPLGVPGEICIAGAGPRAAITSVPTSPPRSSSSSRIPTNRASTGPATSADGCPTDGSSATDASTIRSRSAATASSWARSRPRSPRTRRSSARRSSCASPRTAPASWPPTSRVPRT